nr:FecR domain-containing protein [Burkholderia sp. WAC0059]
MHGFFLDRAAASPLLVCAFALGAPLAAHAQSASAPSRGTIAYTTQPGDSLYNVADRYLADPGDWTALARLNRVGTPEHLQPGHTLRLPVALLRQVSQAAGVLATSGPASRSWRNGPFLPLIEGSSLVEGDRIQTGDEGFATLELPDGTHLVILPNSLVEIGTLRQTVLTGSVDRVMNLRRGEVDSEVTHATKKDDRFQIRSPSVVAGVRGTRFRVDYADNGSTAVEVLDGAVGVDNARAAPARGVPLQASTQLVTARHGSLTPAGAAVGSPRLLLDEPTLIRAARVQSDADVYFDVKPLDGAHGYRVQIGRDAGLLDLIRDVRSDGTHVVVGPLPDGTYFVRVSAIDADGLEGMPATYAFERRRFSLSASAGAAGAHNYVFRWMAGRSASPTHYRFVLSASKDLHAPLVDRSDLPGNALTVSNLAHGVYYWTVIAEQFDHGRFYQKVGAVQSFRIEQ